MKGKYFKNINYNEKIMTVHLMAKISIKKIFE